MDTTIWSRLRWLLQLHVLLVATSFALPVSVVCEAQNQITIAYDGSSESAIGYDGASAFLGSKENDEAEEGTGATTWQEYERAIQNMYGGPASFSVRQYQAVVNGELVNGVADNYGEIIKILMPKTPMRHEGRINVPDGLLMLEFAPRGEYLIYWRKRAAPPFLGISGSIPGVVLTDEQVFGEVLSLVKKLTNFANPVYGDIQNMDLLGWDTPMDLEKRLPDVPWLSIYGSPYVQLFGEDKIRSAPFYKIEKLPSGHFWLQSTESIYEPVPESVRSAIRKHLGEESFMCKPRWRYKDGKAPFFDFLKVAT